MKLDISAEAPGRVLTPNPAVGPGLRPEGPERPPRASPGWLFLAAHLHDSTGWKRRQQNEVGSGFVEEPKSSREAFEVEIFECERAEVLRETKETIRR